MKGSRLGRRGFVAATLGALGASSALRSTVRAQAYTFRMSITSSVNNEYFTLATRYVRGVERRTNGRLSIEVYPNSSLAPQSQVISALQNGVVDLTIQSNSLMSTLIPRMQVFDLPFMFKDAASAYRVLDGSIGTDFLTELDSHGIVGLAWGDDGFRQIETVSRRIVNPDDMKSLRLRVQNGPLYTGMMQALGAIPVVIDANEIYTALQQKVIDGLEFPVTAFAAEKLYEITRNVAVSNHVFTVSAANRGEAESSSRSRPICKRRFGTKPKPAVPTGSRSSPSARRPRTRSCAAKASRSPRSTTGHSIARWNRCTHRSRPRSAATSSSALPA